MSRDKEIEFNIFLMILKKLRSMDNSNMIIMKRKMRKIPNMELLNDKLIYKKILRKFKILNHYRSLLRVKKKN